MNIFIAHVRAAGTVAVADGPALATYEACNFETLAHAFGGEPLLLAFVLELDAVAAGYWLIGAETLVGTTADVSTVVLYGQFGTGPGGVYTDGFDLAMELSIPRRQRSSQPYHPCGLPCQFPGPHGEASAKAAAAITKVKCMIVQAVLSNGKTKS